MRVTVYGGLRAATGAKTVEVDTDVETIAEALGRFVEAYPRARSQLFDAEGEIRPSVRVMRDGERVELDTACPPEAELQLFPAMQGGSENETRDVQRP